jgi:uncharacterized protein
MVLGLILALRLAIRSYLGERSDFLRWPPAEISQRPAQTGIAELREIYFPGPSGIRLAGWYAPSHNRAAIVLTHGTNTDRSSMLPETKILAAAGFGVLAFDFPGQGASGGKTQWGAPERQSISAAIDWLDARAEVDPARIGGFGMSMGGYILIQTAAVDTRLRAVALGAAPSDVVEQTRLASNQWGFLTEVPAVWALRASGMPFAEMVPRDVIGRIAPRPVLLLGGDRDRVVPETMTRSLYQAAREPKELWIVPGAHHGDYVKAAPEEYRRRLIEYFRRTLLS